MAGPATAASGEQGDPVASEPPPRVLVTDDDEVKRYTIVRTLEAAGIRTIAAADGREALARALDQPDLIILDLGLPDLSGYEVRRELRRSPATADIPVLFASATVDHVDLRAHGEVEAEGHIRQPIDVEELLAQVRTLVRLHRSERRLRQANDALRRSEARLRRLWDAGLFGLIYWDLDGAILDANDAFLQMLGYSRAELEAGALDWKKLTPPGWDAVDARAVEQLRTVGKCAQFEKQYRHKDGSIVDVQLSATSFTGEEGPERGVTAVLDITGRRSVERDRQELISRLAESEKRYRLAMRATTEAIWDWDLAGGLILWSGIEDQGLFGYPREEVSTDFGWWEEHLHPQDRARVVSGLKRAVAEARPYWEDEYRFLRADGRYAHVFDRGRISLGPDAKPVRMVGAMQDVSRRKSAEERAQHLQALALGLAGAVEPAEVARIVLEQALQHTGASAGSVLVTEADGSLLLAGSFGYAEKLTAAFRRIVPTEDTPAGSSALAGEAVWVRSRAELERQWPTMVSNAMPQHRAWAAIPMTIDARVIGVIALSFTEEREFTPEERAYFASIAQLCAQALERSQLYARERTAKVEAQRAAELAQQLMGVVGHDLRNPLQAIVMATASLQRENAPREVVLKAANRIAGSADRMAKMIRDLLDFTEARLGGGIKVKRAPMDLVALTTELVDELALASPQDILFTHEGDCRGEWDLGRLSQVVTNLVGNAVKHGAAGRPVRVHLDGTETSQVQLSVRNEGEAIPERLVPELFAPFRRGDSSRRDGIGLGLYIVRQIVASHGGEVTVRSDAGATTFTVRLPR